MSRLDLRRSDDRQTFSSIQLRGFARLKAACRGEAAEAEPLLTHMANMARRHGFADGKGPQYGDAGHRRLSADAVAYVALGSQLGLTVLRKELGPGDRTGIFEREPDLSAWKALAARLSTMPGDTGAGRKTVDDACRAFAIFYSACVDTMNLQSEKLS